MELFKYCRRQHMASLLERGSVRIGTLFDWRKTDRYGELVTDCSEGYTDITGNVIFYDWRFIGSMQHKGSVEVRDDGTRHFKNEAFYTTDHYAFSASTVYSREEHQHWLKKEGYDACYKIHSARLFFRALSEASALANAADFVCFGQVHYLDPSQSNHILHGTFHPALVKRFHYGSQAEVRALWAPKGHLQQGIDPLTLLSSAANRYASEYRVLTSP